jgi:hypothetical protein
MYRAAISANRLVSPGPAVSSSSLDDMFKVTAVVQQILTEVNVAVSKEDKIVVITKIVFKLMKHNGH